MYVQMVNYHWSGYDTVFEHVSELYKKEKEPIIGVFTGTEEEKWDTQRIFVEKKAFHARIEMCCTHRQPFYIKVRTTTQNLCTDLIEVFI